MDGPMHVLMSVFEVLDLHNNHGMDTPKFRTEKL